MKNERSSNKFELFDLRMLQWASKFATSTVELSVEIHKFFFFFFFFFFLRDFIFKKTLFEKLQYLKQEQ